MIQLEFENRAGCKVTDEEWHKIEQVMMNAKPVRSAGAGKIIDLYQRFGMEVINMMYEMVEERSRFIDEIGELRHERTDILKENQKLRGFRDTILKAYKEAEAEGNRPKKKIIS